ncbi:uncharacterized protein LOC119650911 [Hermetia illucens]|uniref:uncharacterized protein LOC119650911 n=1 Tax=Hermetia illucens TaxID=343691 RepID=UPI0018CC0599|nr:uncharacterized protein LOC119650911 [Hermetia illucens]
MSSFYSNTININKNDIAFYQHSPNTKYLIVKNHIFHKNSSSNNNTYWRCRYFRRMHCHARAVSKPNAVILTCPVHNHAPMYQEREIVLQNKLKKMDNSKVNGDDGADGDNSGGTVNGNNTTGSKVNNRRKR